MQARTLCFLHVAYFVECEPSALLVALQFALESGYAQVNFESNYQTML
jgi:hypothetical protein